MNIVNRNPNELVPYENNPRHNDDAVDAVAKSIQQFGFRQPIVVDANNVIVVGHTRWRAAIKLGLSEVPVHVASDLTPEQARAYRIADNKLGEIASWDENLLAKELEALGENDGLLEVLGFDDKEIDTLLGEKLGVVDYEYLPPPKFVWALIGAPVDQYQSISQDVERIGKHDGVFVSVTTSNMTLDDVERIKGRLKNDEVNKAGKKTHRQLKSVREACVAERLAEQARHQRRPPVPRV